MTRRIILVDIGAGLTLRGVLPSVALFATYSAALKAGGGQAPYTYTVVAGAAELAAAGLYLDAATGIISGTAGIAGTLAFTVRVTDLSGAYIERPYSITVIAEPLSLSGAAPPWTVGTPYSYTYTAAHGVPPYAWSLAAGSLPDGITLNASTGTISGTPTAAGAPAWTIHVADSDGGQLDLRDNVSLQLLGTFAAGTVGVAYSSDIAINGGDLPYSNPRVTLGALPAGLTTLSIVSGKLRLSGTPTAVATSSFTVTLDSGDGQMTSSAQAVGVVANPHFDKIVYQHNMAGDNGSTVFTDVQGNTWTTLGNAHIDTSRGYNVGEFDGTGDYLEALLPVGADSITLEGLFTVDAWIIVPPTGSIRAICSHRPNSGLAGWVFWIRDNSQLGFAYSGGGAGVAWADVTTGSLTLVPGSLAHVEVGFDGTAVRTFVNGNMSAKVTSFGGVKTPASSGTPAYIGRDRVGNGTRDWLPAIKAVRVWSGVCMHSSDASFVPDAAPWPTP